MTLCEDTLIRLLGPAGPAADDIPGLLLLPEGKGPFPAVLYCHSHGGDYSQGKSELVAGTGWTLGPYAPDLLARGFAVHSLDMAGFEERRGDGSESALSKAELWHGRTLFGRMLGDLRSGLDTLAAHPDVDARRIFTLGGSMGGAHALWLAAIDARVAGAAHMFVCADLAMLVATGQHDRHGPYLTVPGLLVHGDIGDIAGLIAPRPQFAATGGQDRFTPKAARLPAEARLRNAYGTGPLHLMHEPDTGHKETYGMRRAVLDFLTTHARAPETERIGQ